MVVGSLTDKWSLEPVSAADIPEMVAIERASFSDPWTAGGLRSALDVAGAFVRCARPAVGGERPILGYVVAWFVADEGQIANLVVRADARRRGIGAWLLDETLRQARARGAHSVHLDVRDSNVAARALYASRGFISVGRRRGYYRAPDEDAILLRVLLGPELDDAMKEADRQ
jgi:ribosomal-protein-alanine N-acetyltransferase